MLSCFFYIEGIPSLGKELRAHETLVITGEHPIDGCIGRDIIVPVVRSTETGYVEHYAR